MPSSSPLLTLQQLREAGPLGQKLILAARRHVGEAGLEQAASLERLLVACRHQSAVAMALRSLEWALNRNTDDERPGARAALLTSLHAQLHEAEHAETVLARALKDITSTPVVFLSAASLSGIELGARTQITQAAQLVAQARQSGVTPEERETLRQVDQGMQSALEEAKRQELDDRAESLTYMIREAAARLIDLPTLPNPALADLLEDVALTLRLQAHEPTSPERS